jgi:hypothetical protein
MRRSRLLILAITALWACGDNTGPSPPPTGGAPANLVVAPNGGKVALSWDPVSGATGYVVYRRNTPGVTTTNGTRVPATGATLVGDRVTFDDPGRPDGPVYYIVTALTGGREGSASSEGVGVVNSKIGLFPTGPTAGLRTVDSVTVRTGAASQFEIATFTASVDDRRVPLRFVDQGPGRQFWLGILELAGLATGPKLALITLTDVRGDSALASIPITYVGRATVSVDSPLPYTVARPTVRLTVHCQATSAGQCARIFVSDAYSGTQFVDVAGSSVDQSLDLTAFPNGVRLVIDVTDDHQLTVGRAVRDVFVEPSPALVEYATVPSRVLDLEPGLVLYADSAPDGSGEVLKLRTLASATDATVFAEAGALFPAGVVTASGAVVFQVNSHQGIPARLYQWRNGSLTSLGGIYFTPSLQTVGDFVIWQADNLGALLLRDVLAGTTTTVAAASAQFGQLQTSPGVAANGDVVYSTGSSVVRYRGGVSTVLASSPIADTTYTSPTTDGQSVVYLKLIGYPRADYALFTTAEATLARDSVGMPAGFGRSYFLNAGWVAYNRTGPSQVQQTWVRAPDGTATQVTFFSRPTVPEAIGPTGELVYGDGVRRFRTVPPYTGAAVDVGSDHYRGLYAGAAVAYCGAKAYVIIGRSVFTFAP